MKLSVNNPPNFSETFKQYADQTEGDNAWPPSASNEYRVNPVTNVIDYSAIHATNDTIVHDLGAIVGNTWTLRFKLTINTLVLGVATNGFFGMSDSDETEGGISFQQLIMFRLQNSVSGITSSGIESDNGQPSGIPREDEQALAWAERAYWVEIIRVNEVQYTVSIFDDPDYTKLLARSVGVTSSAVNALRFIKFTGINSGGATGTLDGSITDVEFWENEVPNTPIENVPNFEDDFEIDKGWVQDGTLLTVNTIQNTIDWDTAPLTNYEDVLTFDLGVAVSETFWTLRCKVTEVVVNSSSANAFQWGIGLSNNVLDSGSGQDWIGSRYIFSNTQNLVTMSTANNTQVRSNNFPVPILNAVGIVHFLEIRRLTSTTCIMNIYADADFSQLIGTTGEIVISAGITQLRFLKVWTRATSAANGEFSGTIEDIELFTDKGATKIQDWREVNG